jgi:hypothetical protein
MQVIEDETLASIKERYDFWAREVSRVSKEDVLLFRSLFESERLLSLRRWIHGFRLSQGLSGHHKYSRSTPDHVKVVDKPLTDVRPTRFEFYQFFPWNEQNNPDFKALTTELTILRNLLSGLPPETGYPDTSRYISWPCILHYRRGGDFLAPHRDDYAYQLILLLSERGKDFEEGGNYVLQDGKHRFLEPELQFGDVILLKSDIYHGVHAIDPHLPLVETSEDGRWIMFFPLSEASILES